MLNSSDRDSQYIVIRYLKLTLISVNYTSFPDLKYVYASNGSTLYFNDFFFPFPLFFSIKILCLKIKLTPTI